MATAVVMVCLVALHCSGITAAPVSGQVFVATEDTYAQTLGWLKTHGYYKGQVSLHKKPPSTHSHTASSRRPANCYYFMTSVNRNAANIIYTMNLPPHTVTLPPAGDQQIVTIL